MTTQSQRGKIWLDALTRSKTAQPGFPASVQVVDGELGGVPARYIAVVPDPAQRFPRARNGEVGLLEGWALAQAVQEVMQADRDKPGKRPIIAVIDVPSQAYGRREEAYGIHQALAGAADAYASARLAGHSIIGLIVGRAMSGAFLAHGYQANRLIAFDDPQVMVHAMGKASAARVTLRTAEELEAFTASVAPMAYDIANFATLGLLWKLLPVSNPDRPGEAERDLVEQTLLAALDDIRQDSARDLSGRWQGEVRSASRQVRETLRAQWR